MFSDASILLVILTFFIALIASIISGIGGGGAGFIMIPYYILIGMSPAQAVSTGKFGGLGMAIGSVSAFRGKGLIHKRLLYSLILITVCVSVLAGLLIPAINEEVFQKIIGGLLIALTPTLFIKKQAKRFTSQSKPALIFLYLAYTSVVLLQAMFGTGLGMLVSLLFIFGFGLRPLEASATKRSVQLIQAAIVGIITAFQGLVLLWFAAAAMAGSLIGSHIGAKIAIKGGDGIVRVFLAIIMLGSGVALLLLGGEQ